MSKTTSVTLDTIVALCKRRGFIFPGAEIYGGLNGIYDFGPLGVLLKNKIKQAWTKAMSSGKEEVVFMDGSILGHEEVWKASGHVDNFSDPMVDCLNCKKRFRSDEGDFNIEKGCPSCGIKNWTEVRRFKLMFETQLGAVSGSSSIAYLRPETAQSIFINFKNVISSTRVKIPFGIAQIGKAFRNEITPKQFLFRVREFEQMEVEFFCKPDQSDDFFIKWIATRLEFYKSIGVDMDKIRIRPHAQDELAHYSKMCSDVEYEFPFGWKELEGIAHRSDYDLRQHAQFSGKNLLAIDPQTNEQYLPHVVECSVGVDRLLLTLLFDAYREDEIDGEKRVYLALAPHMAPVSVAVMPLTKHQDEPAMRIYHHLKQIFDTVQFDDGGSIGKRYRRQDEIGTPFCVTYDYDSENDHCVTVRNRDTLVQERIDIKNLSTYLREKMAQ